MSTAYQSYLSIIQAAHPGKAFLSIEEAARLLSKAPGSVRNEISAGRFPVRSIKMGSRRVIPLLAFVVYLDSITSPEQGPGRPRTGSKKGALDV